MWRARAGRYQAVAFILTVAILTKVLELEPEDTKALPPRLSAVRGWATARRPARTSRRSLRRGSRSTRRCTRAPRRSAPPSNPNPKPNPHPEPIPNPHPFLLTTDPVPDPDRIFTLTRALTLTPTRRSAPRASYCGRSRRARRGPRSSRRAWPPAERSAQPQP